MFGTILFVIGAVLAGTFVYLWRGSRIAELQRENTLLRQQFEQRAQEIKGTRDEFEHLVRSISAQVLQDTSAQFTESAKKDLALIQTDATNTVTKGREAIEAMATEVKTHLKKTDEMLAVVEKERQNQTGQIQTNIENLLKSTVALDRNAQQLKSALTTSGSVRGRWGEHTLENLFEICGLVKDRDFFVQSSTTTGDGASLRPDFRVRIPGSQELIIDAKTPLYESYLESATAVTEEERLDKQKAFARKVRDRISELSGKAYQDALGDALPYVVMYLPSEAAIRAAFDADPGLLDWAHGQRVMVTSPATIMPLVLLVGSFRTQLALSENAKRLHDVVDELGSRLGLFFERLTKVQKGLKTATDNWNEALNLSWHGQKGILKSLDKAHELGATLAEAPELSPLDAPVEPPAVEAENPVRALLSHPSLHPHLPLP
jgi:DNA recombination protein RmuC